jgi:CBS domain-containing protein
VGIVMNQGENLSSSNGSSWCCYCYILINKLEHVIVGNSVQCTILNIIYHIPNQYQGNRMSSIETISVSSFMTRDVKTEKEDQNVITACRIMHENNIGCVVIVSKSDSDSEKPIGIITERDVVRLLGSLNPSLLQTPLYGIMSKPLITISIDSSFKDAIQIMQQKKFRRLVIVDKQKMVGIITDKDIFRTIMNNQDLILSLLGDKLLIEPKTIYEQFSEYWFGDILHKR